MVALQGDRVGLTGIASRVDELGNPPRLRSPFSFYLHQDLLGLKTPEMLPSTIKLVPLYSKSLKGVSEVDVRRCHLLRHHTSNWRDRHGGDGVHEILHLWAFKLGCHRGNSVSTVPPQSIAVPAQLASNFMSLSWLVELKEALMSWVNP
ncbi:hypothetical protein BHE74_00013351 [Ensete ventricosum]|nr:hypothetical protein BHE74_00013351 [Ensete ventricosum]